MSALNNNIWDKEKSSSSFIPYSAQITKNCVKTDAGDYITVIRVSGIAHETADAEDIVIWKEQLNNLWRNISSPNVLFYTHIIRRNEVSYPDGDFPDGFCTRLNEKYKVHMSNCKMKVNELYVTILYRPLNSRINKVTNSFFGKILSFFSKRNSLEEEKILQDEQKEAIEKINEYRGILFASLKRYSPYTLGVYEENSVYYSEILEFLAYLVNGEWQKMPLPRCNVSHFIATSRIFFGAEIAEIRPPVGEKRYAATLGFKEYPTITEPGLLNNLLSAPFEFVLTESFIPTSRAIAIERMKRDKARMVNAGEVAESLIEELDVALDDVSAGRIVMGEHHLTFLVFADKKKQLKENLAEARANLAELGIIIAREDLALEAAYWAQLPGNLKYRPRPSLITSKNFSGLSSLHNYPSGRLKYNQWGPAATVFMTSSGTPFYFNHHEALDRKPKKGEEQDKNQQKALANTLIIGPSGSGKTVVQSFLMSQDMKFRPTVVVYDKDRGLEIFIRRMKGVYLPLQKGRPTGFNPMCLDNTPENVMFLEKLIKTLVVDESYKPTVLEEKQLSQAIRDMLRIPVAYRSLSGLLSNFDSSSQEGIYARLKKWCLKTGEGRPGSLHWVFDSGPDLLDMNSNSLFGFDVTEFLDDPLIRTPIIMYLFHRQEQLIDGRRFIAFLDEFWKMLLDPYFEDFAQNKLKTIRKQNGFLVFGTQSARDVLRSPIAHSIIEQCPTQIYMPNDKADYDDYVKGFKLTESEFDIIKNRLQPSSRRFLIKQGMNSVIAELSLKGFENELAIMSGTTDNVLLCERIREEVGEDPEKWEPIFHERRSA